MRAEHSQHGWGPCGAVSSLVESKRNVMEPSAILRYLRPENSKFKTALYQASTPKLPTCHFERYHERSSIGKYIFQFENGLT